MSEERSALEIPIEIELKLESPGAISDSGLVAVLHDCGLEVEPPTKRVHVDRYLDTAGFHLARHGIGLRIRESDGRGTLALKARARTMLDTGLWQRVEMEADWPSEAGAPDRATELPEPLRREIEPFVYDRPLLEVANLVVERRTRALRARDGGGRAELAADRARVGPVSAGLGFAEIEIEDVTLGSEALGAVSSALQARLGLTPSVQDKLGRALALLGQVLPAREPPGLLPATPLRDAAFTSFRFHLDAFQKAEPLAREGIDPEGVHRMRVATRRMRAAFRIFREAFLPARLAARERFMQRSAERLGHVRDLDVMLIDLPAMAGAIPHALAAELEPLAALLEAFQARERARLVAWLESDVRLRAAGHFESWLERGLAAAGGRRPRGAAGRPLAAAAPALIAGAATRVIRRGMKVLDHSSAAELHALRIAIKRLRYTAETFVPLHGELLEDALRRMTKLQDVLGAYNDARVAADRLSGWIDTPAGRKLPRRTLVSAGALIAVCEARAERARGRFKKAWRRFAEGKARRELEEVAGRQLA